MGDAGDRWTLHATDRTLLGNKAGATRLGFAVLLKLFQAEGRFPRRPEDVPAATVEAIRAEFTNSLILSGGYNTAAEVEAALSSGGADLVAIGRPFIANPDLVERLRTGAALAQPDMATLYAPGPKGFEQGFIDYPALSETSAAH